MNARTAALRAIAHPTRLRILKAVAKGERTVRELSDALGLRQPATSQHLQVLRQSGLVAVRRDANRRFYRVEPKKLNELRLFLDGFWNDGLNRLRKPQSRSTGTVRLMSDLIVKQTVTISAPARMVFDLISTAQGLLQWMAVEATSDARIGGRIRWRHESGDVMSGRFVALEPPTRIAFTYGWESGGVPGVPPESTLVEISLEEHDGTTTVHLVHSRLPAGTEESHRFGWSYFLDRLNQVCVANKRRAE